MLTVAPGSGLSRRTFLCVGGLALGGLSLPELLRAEAGRPRRHKSVIMVFLPGGPSHLDTLAPKPMAPSEIRGEFRAIPTRLPGVAFCEYLPRLAALANRLVVVRSLVGAVDEHSSAMCATGRPSVGAAAEGGWPSVGSVVSKARGPARRAVPPFLSVAPRMEHRPYDDPGPGFLGASHSPFTLDERSTASLALSGISLGRLTNRQSLLTGLDRARRHVDARGFPEGLDAFQRQAFDVLTSRELRAAFDLSREPRAVRERYGEGSAWVDPTLKAAPKLMEHFLLARRLVEAGARCVGVAFGAWDYHEKNFQGLRTDLPMLDQGLSALIEDLDQRGLSEDVTVVVWGEFGRTPRVNKTAGRDHWPKVSCALLAGGGMKVGQVLGSTDGRGEEAKDRPVHYREVLATLYHNLGVDPHRLTFHDRAGRPHDLLDGAVPIRELI